MSTGFPEENTMNDFHWNHAGSAKILFEQMDRIRRRRGDALDLAGFGPVETPYRTLHSETGVTLRRYGDSPNNGPVLLIVPAPIKRPYIWDLMPGISVVRACLDRGMRVYLAEWTAITVAEQSFGLADYGDRLLKACLDAIEADCGEHRVALAGHSLGGVLATSFACLYPQHVRAMVLLEAPVHFGADAGDFAPLVAAAPDAQSIERAFGIVPGSFLNAVSAVAAPHAFQWERYVDWSLSMASREAMGIHMRVERWTHDEFALPGRLFAEVVDRLYRNDELMRGTLRVGARQIGPGDLKAPLLNVIDPRSSVIPPRSILPFHQAAASKSKKILQYEGDVGVGIQHVGVLVGSNAHALVWPAIFDWLDEADAIH